LDRVREGQREDPKESRSDHLLPPASRSERTIPPHDPHDQQNRPADVQKPKKFRASL